jgi:hypothetical protein
MENPSNAERLCNVAANPNSMGDHGQPNGRPTEAPQERDSNHPMGTNKRAGLPGGHGMESD